MMSIKALTIYVVVILVCIYVCKVTSVQQGSFRLQPLPPSPKYKAEGEDAGNGGIGPFYDIVRTFISLVLPDISQIIDDISSMMTGSLKMDSLIDLAKSKLIGLVVVLGIGILFILIFPIVGLCFCCCRLCCKCCCAKPDYEDPSASCKRKIYGVCLFVFMSFTVAGNICTYVSNDEMSQALDQISETTSNNLDDVQTFVNFTIDQVQAVQSNFHSAKTVLEEKLDYQKIKDRIAHQALSIFKVDSLDYLQKDVEALKKIKSDMDSSITAITAKVPGMPPPGFPTIPQIPPGLDSISSQATSQLQKVVGDMTKNTNDIQTKMADVKKQLDDAQKKVDDSVKTLQDTIRNGGSMDFDSMKNQVDDMVNMVKPYNKYRWYGGMGCAGVMSLITGLSFLGLCVGSCGGCGGRGDVTKKGCLANSGGRLLMASTIFLFIFGSLLMLLTTILFVPGSMLERYVCQPLTDPELKTIDKLMKDTFSIDDFLAYKNGHVPTIGKMLQNCKENQPVYSAFNFQYLSSGIDLTSVEKTINNTKDRVRGQLKQSLSKIFQAGKTGSTTLLPTSLEASLDQLPTLINKKLVDDLSSMITTMQKSAPDSIRADLDTMQTNVKKLDQIRATLKTSVQKVKDELKNATTNVQKSTAINDMMEGFINDMVKIIDDLFNFIKSAILNEMGKCRPVYNVYHSIINESLCRYIVDSLNGFWCSIGWCILFSLPMAIFGTKLSNQMRDVEYAVEGSKTSMGKVNSLKSRNKVGHMDDKETV